jgi:hypothetical protein
MVLCPLLQHRLDYTTLYLASKYIVITLYLTSVSISR